MALTLRELDGHFVGRLDLQDKSTYRLDDIAEAQGVMFQCPKCAIGVEKTADGRAFIGVHYILCWFQNRGVPDWMDPKPGRWNPAGRGLDDLTFVPPGNTSVALTNPDGCGWHGFVSGGIAE